MLIDLVVGDYSGDGHNVTLHYPIESNLDTDQIWNAYRKGSRLLKLDLVHHIATDYEDSSITKTQNTKIGSLGIELEDEESISPDEFVQVFMETCKKGNADLTLNLVEIPHIDIGGYGLVG